MQSATPSWWQSYDSPFQVSLGTTAVGQILAQWTQQSKNNILFPHTKENEGKESKKIFPFLKTELYLQMVVYTLPDDDCIVLYFMPG